MSELDDLRAENAKLKASNAEMLKLLDQVAVSLTKSWLNNVRDVVSKAKG